MFCSIHRQRFATNASCNKVLCWGKRFRFCGRRRLNLACECRTNCMSTQTSAAKSTTTQGSGSNIDGERQIIEDGDKRIPIFTPQPALERPDHRVTGVSTETISTNPTIAAFYAANFPPSKDEIYYAPEKPLGNLSGSMKSKETFASLEEEKLAKEYNIRPLRCYVRHNMTGKNREASHGCYKLREQYKMTPGAIYGNDPVPNTYSRLASFADSNDTFKPNSVMFIKTPQHLIQREIVRYTFNTFPSRVYNLTVHNNMEDYSGCENDQDNVKEQVVFDETQNEENVLRRATTTMLVVPREVNIHPVKQKLYCLNYLRYYPGRPLKLPIRYINEEESPALKRGGFVIPVNKYLEVIVEDGVPIPEQLDLECTGVQHRDKLRLERIILPDGVKVSRNVNKETWLHGPVIGKYSNTNESEDVDGDAAKAASTAEGSK